MRDGNRKVNRKSFTHTLQDMKSEHIGIFMNMNYMEVSENVGTPSHHPFEWDHRIIQYKPSTTWGTGWAWFLTQGTQKLPHPHGT